MNEQPRKDIHNSDVPALCKACEARHRGICGALNAEQLTYLSKWTNRQVVDQSEEIMGAYEDIHRYANILGGVVKLMKLMPDGRQQIVGLQFAPDFIGRPFRRQSGVSAEAANDVKVCSFPANVLEKLVAEAPELEHRLHEQALKELDEAREWMLTLGRKTAIEKMASFLYLIATHIDPEDDANEDGPVRFDLPLKRADIADFLGLTIETVSRQITKLRKAGVIELEGNRIVVVPNLERLLGVAEGDDGIDPYRSGPSLS